MPLTTAARISRSYRRCSAWGGRDVRRSVREQGRGIREVLRAVEDALIDAGYDDFWVSIEHGTFHWRTVERARADAAKGGNS
jgi:hypothetical protein